MNDQNVYRVRRWTHHDLSSKAGTVISASFRTADPKRETVMLAIGDIPRDQGLTREMLLEMLKENGLALIPEADVHEAEEDE